MSGSSCVRCGSPALGTRRYCWACGARQAPVEATPGVCARCGFVNGTTHHWCGGCGLALVADAAERRQLTVMFCDLVGSTSMSAVLDAEDLRAVNRAYQETVTAAIERFGGFVARYMGDGVLAYFGWPRAHEDDPIRAVRAGLATIGDVARVEADIGARLGVEIAVRIGVATGRVVVGDLVGEGAAQEAAVVGATPNLAARLQGEAEPNGIVVSASTRRRLGTAFRVESLGVRPLKGIPEPEEIFAVRGERAGLEDVASAPLWGRQAELSWLESRRAEAVGEGGVAWVIGEAGVGKSHLVGAFASGRPHVRIVASPWHAGRALHPFLRWAREQEPSDALAALLVWASEGGEGVDDAEAAARAQRLSDGLLALVQEQVGPGGLVLVEDVPGLDPTSLALVGRLVEAPVFLLLTARPGAALPWEGARLDLGRVDPAAAGAIVEEVAAGTLPAEVVAHILAKTDGIPLFVEELTRTLLASGQLVREGVAWRLLGALEELSVPDTLQDSLMARLDQLGYVKPLAQVAAVVGRRFSRADVEVLSGRTSAELDAALEVLVSARVVVEAGADWQFRHALLHETAYDSLLRSRRRELHHRYADHLLAVGGHAAVLAVHLEEAGRRREAAERWVEAGEESVRHGAMVEAIAFAERALASARCMDPCPGDLEVDLRVKLAEWLRAAERLPEALTHLEAAERRAQETGHHEQLAAVHSQRGNLYFLTGELDGCLAEHEAALAHAEAAGSDLWRARALGGLGDAHYVQGRVVSGRRYFEDCVALAEQGGFARVAAANRVMIGWTALFGLDLAGAERQLSRALEECEAIGHLRSQMVAAGGLAWLGLLAGRHDLVEAHLPAAAGIAERLGSPSFGGIAAWYASTLALQRGDREGARAHVLRAIGLLERGTQAFLGAGVQGRLAEVALSAEERERALARGWELLESGTVMVTGHLWFHESAIEALLACGDLSGVERHVAALEQLGADHMPMDRFVLARTRVLLAARRGEPLTDLPAVLEAGRRAGLGPSLEALEQLARG